jgi:environmental stress-induced protein Ves
MRLDKAATWALTAQLGGDTLVELVRLETHSCYLGDRSRLHSWGYGCNGCPACALRKAGWERYQAGKPHSARLTHPTPTIQRFALADAKPEPWKNGLGVTRTLVTDRDVDRHADKHADTPTASGNPDWSWRISVADIEKSGSFSTFEQVDRTLILLHGGPLILNRSGAPITLSNPGEPTSFDGEETVDAQIAATAVQALNLMTRRGQVHSTVSVIKGEPVLDSVQGERLSPLPNHHRASSITLTTVATVAFVAFVVAGSYRIEWSAGDSTAKQSLILRSGEGVVLREASGIGLVSALEIEVDTPSLRSNSAVGSQPWLILITLESSIDYSATIVP